jgi:hypothetical protein
MSLVAKDSRGKSFHSGKALRWLADEALSNRPVVGFGDPPQGSARTCPAPRGIRD